MKKIIILLTVLVITTVAFASTINESMAKIVRIWGYSCTECVQVDFKGNKHRGKEYRAICDYERNAFRVTAAPDGRVYVEPW